MCVSAPGMLYNFIFITILVPQATLSVICVKRFNVPVQVLLIHKPSERVILAKVMLIIKSNKIKTLKNTQQCNSFIE